MKLLEFGPLVFDFFSSFLLHRTHGTDVLNKDSVPTAAENSFGLTDFDILSASATIPRSILIAPPTAVDGGTDAVTGGRHGGG